MRHLPDGDKKWMLHGVDHWSKFNFAYGIPSMQAVDVALVLNTYIFPYFGVPKILHSDNGRKFKVIENMALGDTASKWPPPSPTKRRTCRESSLHPRKKAVDRTKLKQPPWNSWLPRIACKLLIMFTPFTAH